MDHVYLLAMVVVAFAGLLITARAGEGALTPRTAPRAPAPQGDAARDRR